MLPEEKKKTTVCFLRNLFFLFVGDTALPIGTIQFSILQRIAIGILPFLGAPFSYSLESVVPVVSGLSPSMNIMGNIGFSSTKMGKGQRLLTKLF